jgi:hypothetical protein
MENCKLGKPQPLSKHVLVAPPPNTKHVLLILDRTYGNDKCYKQTKQSDYSKAIKLVSNKTGGGSKDGSAGGANCGSSGMVVIPLQPLRVIVAAATVVVVVVVVEVVVAA